MTLEDFLTHIDVPTRATDDAVPVRDAPVALDCALLAQDDRRLVVERHGTTYEVEKADVVGVEMPVGPVVTESRGGHPVRLVLHADAELLAVRRRRAAELEAVLPMVLARPSGALGLETLEPPSRAAWYRERGIVVENGPLVEQTDTFSPSPSARHAETASAAGGPAGAWASDDATAAGFATDETWQDDIKNDHDWVG